MFPASSAIVLAAAPNVNADITMLPPRAKDLGSDFSDEDKTCFLSSLLADLAVAPPKPAVGASGSSNSRAAASASLSGASSFAFSLPAVHPAAAAAAGLACFSEGSGTLLIGLPNADKGCSRKRAPASAGPFAAFLFSCTPSSSSSLLSGSGTLQISSDDAAAAAATSWPAAGAAGNPDGMLPMTVAVLRSGERVTRSFKRRKLLFEAETRSSDEWKGGVEGRGDWWLQRKMGRFRK